MIIEDDSVSMPFIQKIRSIAKKKENNQPKIALFRHLPARGRLE
jgi:hypothetical protein